MLNKLLILVVTTSLALFLTACSDDSNVNNKEVKRVEGRWYTSAQLIRGKKVFKNNCAVCHGSEGQGLTKNWQKALPDGKFPAPPLNGSAHSWHHSKGLLLQTLNNGGIPLGGSMPAFKDKLTDKEKEAVLAHVMSLWPEEVYSIWNKRNP